MEAQLSPGNLTFDKQKFFKDTAIVVVIDDKGGDALSAGEMTKTLCQVWAKSALLFHVKNIEGESAEQKIEDFKSKLEAVIAPQSNNIIFVLDRDLDIGNLPLSAQAKQSVAAEIDNRNDGPALVPYIKKWFNNAPIVGFTGEGDTTGMVELYSGARVAQKPYYQALQACLYDSYAESYAPDLNLKNERL